MSAGRARAPTARPELSLVIVAWRSREQVRALLCSIEQHADLDHEIIVIDDGSADGTAEAVRREFPAVRLVAKARNEGLVRGRNTALGMFRGRLVLMLDADTQLRPGAVRALAAVLDSRPDVGLVGPRLVGPDGAVQPSCRRWSPFWIPLLRRGPYAHWVNDDPPSHRRHLMLDFDHRAQRPVVWVNGAAQMWRAELPARIGRYDSRLSSYGGEDKDWCLRVWSAGMQVLYVPEAEIMHEWQHVIRSQPYGRGAWRALWDWYYLQFKHRALRTSPLLEEANR